MPEPHQTTRPGTESGFPNPPFETGLCQGIAGTVAKEPALHSVSEPRIDPILRTARSCLRAPGPVVPIRNHSPRGALFHVARDARHRHSERYLWRRASRLVVTSLRWHILDHRNLAGYYSCESVFTCWQRAATRRRRRGQV